MYNKKSNIIKNILKNYYLIIIMDKLFIGFFVNNEEYKSLPN